MASTYLTRSEVAERYPISVHTLAKLASQGRGPRYFKPTDKCLYRPEDIEAWIEAAAIMPSAVDTKKARSVARPGPTAARKGETRNGPAKTTDERQKVSAALSELLAAANGLGVDACMILHHPAVQRTRQNGDEGWTVCLQGAQAGNAFVHLGMAVAQ